MKKYSQGFTIVELLVVVAIIGVLAAIVMTNVTSYINRGKNAGVKANLSSATTNAALFFQVHGAYQYWDGFMFAGYCNDPSYTRIRNEVNSIIGANPVCANNSNNWCACSTMKTTAAEPNGSTFCVDSTGYKKVTENGCLVRCPAGAACVD